MKLQEVIQFIQEKMEVDLQVDTRKRESVYARAIYFKVTRELFPRKSLEHIGSLVGRDHASVLHGINKVFPMIKLYEPTVYEVYEDTRAMILHNISNVTGEEYNESKNSKVYKKELNKYYAKCKYLEAKVSLYEEQYSTDELVRDYIKRVPSEKYDLFLTRLDAMTKMISL
jgi:hypothetical protein